MPIETKPLDINKLVESLVAGTPATIAACVAAWLSWHNNHLARGNRTRLENVQTSLDDVKARQETQSN